MTGIEKIISSIELKSAQKCEDILALAKKEAEGILDRANADVKALLDETEEKMKIQAEEIVKMAESAAQQKSKQIILKARIEAINIALSAAASELKTMPVAEYFNSLHALAAANARQGTGQMKLSESDLERLPANFENDLNKVLDKKGSIVSICKEPALISDGFILIYGDIEINCTFDALIEDSREELKEKICAIIF